VRHAPLEHLFSHALPHARLEPHQAAVEGAF